MIRLIEGNQVLVCQMEEQFHICIKEGRKFVMEIHCNEINLTYVNFIMSDRVMRTISSKIPIL